MIKYREILRLHAQGLSQRGIASSCSNSRNTISEALKRAQVHGISWPFEKDMSDGDLQELLFPKRVPSLTSEGCQTVNMSTKNWQKAA